MNANMLCYVGIVACLECTLGLPISEEHLEVVAKLVCFIFFKTLCFKVQCFLQTVGTQMVLQDFSLTEAERFKILVTCIL